MVGDARVINFGGGEGLNGAFCHLLRGGTERIQCW